MIKNEMPYMVFKYKVLDKLEKYKENVLGIKKNGIFLYKGEDKSKGHILPICQGESKKSMAKKYNVLSCLKDEEFLINEKDLHRYAHHLNSSQLMCYNYFRPLIDEKGHASEKLISILKAMGINIESSCNSQCVFEYEQNSGGWETEGRKTNFDFYVKSEETEVFFEIKYTEQGFGKAKKDKAHKDKYDNFYKAKISECHAIAPSINKYDDYFINNYQLIRNVIRITDKNKYVVFIYDDNNEIVNSQLNEFIKTNIVQLKENIICVTWQKMVEELEPEHQNQFKEKYLSYNQ